MRLCKIIRRKGGFYSLLNNDFEWFGDVAICALRINGRNGEIVSARRQGRGGVVGGGGVVNRGGMLVA